MNLYFIYRSPYEPTNKYLKVFQGESLLSWFVEKWALFKSATEDQSYDLAISLFDKYVYGFDNFIFAVSEERLPKPKTFKKLARYISEHAYNQEVEYQEGCIQVYTDDDELEMAWYFFDEPYAKAHAEKVAFLLYDAVALPDQFASMPFTASLATKVIATHSQERGSCYFAFSAAYAGDNLDSLEGVLEIKGVRMENLFAFLRQTSIEREVSFELDVLQRMIVHHPKASQAELFEQISKLPLLDIYEMDWESTDYNPATWKQIKGRLDHNPEKSFCIIKEHHVQLSIHTGETFNKDTYHYWIIFDHLWAGANNLLANGILHYSHQWNFL